jgi:hypothetical protein
MFVIPDRVLDRAKEPLLVIDREALAEDLTGIAEGWIGLSLNALTSSRTDAPDTPRIDP